MSEEDFVKELQGEWELIESARGRGSKFEIVEKKGSGF
jgi:hypothetical protein